MNSSLVVTLHYRRRDGGSPTKFVSLNYKNDSIEPNVVKEFPQALEAIKSYTLDSNDVAWLSDNITVCQRLHLLREVHKFIQLLKKKNKGSLDRILVEPDELTDDED